MDKHSSTFSTLLRDRGSKATPGRIAILTILKKHNEPLSALEIHNKLQGALDKVTVYRVLDALLRMSIIRKVDFREQYARYELLEVRDHHHHLVCEDCGKVEDVEGCNPVLLEKDILSTSSSFAKVVDHSLEFFGVCKKCAQHQKCLIQSSQ